MQKNIINEDNNISSPSSMECGSSDQYFTHNDSSTNDGYETKKLKTAVRESQILKTGKRT